MSTKPFNNNYLFETSLAAAIGMANKSSKWLDEEKGFLESRLIFGH